MDQFLSNIEKHMEDQLQSFDHNKLDTVDDLDTLLQWEGFDRKGSQVYVKKKDSKMPFVSGLIEEEQEE